MNEIIKKIDEEIEKCNELDKNAPTIKYKNVITGLKIAKEFISSSQKEPCKYCENEILTVRMEFGYNSYMGKDGWVSSTRHPKVCPMCGRQLNQKVEEE